MSEMRTEQNLEDSQRPSDRPEIVRDNRYWLSLEDWSKDPEFQKHLETEFQSSPLREGADQEEGWARREFLKLMGASLAMGAAGCVRRPVQKIVPYNKQPEEVTLGVSNYYTSTFSDGHDSVGILVKTREGRPLKVEGNPKHPWNGKGLSARAQAHILSLYDPERLTGPQQNLFNKTRTNADRIGAKYDDIDAAVAPKLKEGGVAVLTSGLSSAATRAVVADFCQAFGAKHYVWDPTSGAETQAMELCFGAASVVDVRYDLAKLIVSIDGDFLGTGDHSTRATRLFAKGRKDLKTMSQLVSFDSTYSLTGANADIRARIKPSMQTLVAGALAHEIFVVKKAGAFAGQADVVEKLKPFAGAKAQLANVIASEVFDQLVNDLIKNMGSSVIVATGPQTQTEQGLSLQILVNLLNSGLGNEGKTILARSAGRGEVGSVSALSDLLSAIEKGDVKTLIIHRANVVYASPLGEKFAEAIKKVNLVVSTSDRFDEIAKLSHYVIPSPHPMEAWGDVQFDTNGWSIQQPTIQPMHDTRSFEFALMSFAYTAEVGPARLKDSETFYDYLKGFWKSDVYPSFAGNAFEAFWEQALQDGFVWKEASAVARKFQTTSLAKITSPTSGATLELALHFRSAYGDGTSLMNVAWLHELPDPVTKVCWDHYASVSFATAERLKLKTGSMIELALGEKKFELPILVQPGLHDEVVAVALGLGRKDSGQVAQGIGVNAYEMAQALKENVVFAGQPVSLIKKNGFYKLAQTQDHHSMEGRQIVVEATLKQYLKNPEANIHRHKVFSIWGGHQYNGNKWGMAIDLNSCTGCSACVIACQSENNISVVGRKYVIEGREMHWIRIDRYYVGSPENAEAVFQPIMCQHCDNAPCETVCPVLATVHNSEGLNDMVYNRCVGTRYCANNCPYKVRRFNWFNYTKNIEKPMHLALNPDVTVRSRGVMEKCTFCVQRIKEGKNKAKLAGRALKDGDIQTACSQSCPTDAITFGDLNDPTSAVAQVFKSEPRAYTLLEEWHAAPVVRYMSKIRNNNQDSRGGGHGGGHGDGHGKDSASEHKGGHS